jgi:hypothetical protein
MSDRGIVSRVALAHSYTCAMHSRRFAPRVLFAAVLLTAIGRLAAQTVEFITVEYQQRNQQTGAATVVADALTPYRFQAEVDGTGITGSAPLSAATVTYNSITQNLTYSSGSSNWRYQSSAYQNLADLVAAFPTGSYAMALTGAPTGSATITLNDPSSTTINAPLLTLSSTGGAWSGNAYYFNPANTLSISFNAVFTGTPAGTKGYNYSVDLSGANAAAANTPTGFIHYDPTTGNVAPDTIATFTIGASTLVSGSSYVLEVTYQDIQSVTANALGSITSGALVSRSTFVNLVAVPEPATWTAWLGALALAAVAMRRGSRSMRRPV